MFTNLLKENTRIKAINEQTWLDLSIMPHTNYIHVVKIINTIRQ